MKTTALHTAATLGNVVLFVSTNISEHLKLHSDSRGILNKRESVTTLDKEQKKEKYKNNDYHDIRQLHLVLLLEQFSFAFFEHGLSKYADEDFRRPGGLIPPWKILFIYYKYHL